jgi:c-di-GMP-binding flagellar brake protein YcgR
MRFTLFKIDNEDVSFYGPVEIEGEVRYSIQEAGQCRIGVRFTKIDEDDKREIANFAAMAIHLLNKDKK